MAPLTVALDLRHPFSFLALEPTIRFALETGVAVDWLPIRGQSLRPPSEPAPGDDRSIRHRRARARMIAREIEVYGAAAGLEIVEPYRDGPADAAEWAWLWVRDQQPDRLEAFLRELFRRYWRGDLDPTALPEVVNVLEGLGCEVSAFRAWTQGAAARRAHAAAAATLAGMGVNQGPAYVLDGEVFYGRQHLPMLRWILDGRSGPGPI